MIPEDSLAFKKFELQNTTQMRCGKLHLRLIWTSVLDVQEAVQFLNKQITIKSK